ncbi:MAG: Na+/H+ antiporter subunit E [Coriobacteriia bacterium]
MKFAQSATLLMAFWMLLTGSVKPFDLVFGLTLSLLLAWWAVTRLWNDGDAPVLTWRQALRFLAYVVYLIKEIVLAAVGVAGKVLDPRMPIDPVVITHRTRFSRQVSRVALANSITLTPGTLTVDLDGDMYVVHCLNEEFSESISNGEFEGRIKRVFEE